MLLEIVLCIPNASAIDPSLGRLDYESLSDQALMEMLITPLDFEDKKSFQDENGNFSDVCEWDYVVCKDDRVIEFDSCGLSFGKDQFPFQFIPPLVDFFRISPSKVRGTLDTSHLPSSLTIFDVSKNLLHGSINWLTFPRTLVEIEMRSNKFHGSCLLQDLPNGITHLDASYNKLSGDLSLDNMPQGMVKLYLQNNDLCGSIRFDRFPPSMTTLDLSYNFFSGDVRLPTLPPVIEHIGMVRNKLSGTFVTPKTDTFHPVELKCEHITAVLDETGQRHEWEENLKEHAAWCERDVLREERCHKYAY